MPFDEGAVDLHDADRKVLHVRERRVTGAEVVDRERDAEIVQLHQPGPFALFVDRDERLGELEREPQLLRVDVLVGEQLRDRLDQVRLGELAGREVDAQAQALVGRPGPGSRPRRWCTLR